MIDVMILLGITGAVAAVVGKKVRNIREGKSGCGCGCSGCAGCKTEKEYHPYGQMENRHGRELWRFCVRGRFKEKAPDSY